MGICTTAEDINNKNASKSTKYPKKKVTFNEKVTVFQDQIKVAAIDQTFDKFDRDQDGFLNQKELNDLIKYSYGCHGG